MTRHGFSDHAWCVSWSDGTCHDACRPVFPPHAQSRGWATRVVWRRNVIVIVAGVIMMQVVHARTRARIRVVRVRFPRRRSWASGNADRLAVAQVAALGFRLAAVAGCGRMQVAPEANAASCAWNCGADRSAAPCENQTAERVPENAG